MVIVNPNNPNGGTFDLSVLPDLLRPYPDTCFLVDEAFIGLAGESVAHLVPKYRNLLVTRTLLGAGMHVDGQGYVQRGAGEII